MGRVNAKVQLHDARTRRLEASLDLRCALVDCQNNLLDHAEVARARDGPIRGKRLPDLWLQPFHPLPTVDISEAVVSPGAPDSVTHGPALDPSGSGGGQTTLMRAACEGHRTGLPCLPLDDDCAAFFFPAFALLLIFSVSTPPPFLPPAPLSRDEVRKQKGPFLRKKGLSMSIGGPFPKNQDPL